MGRWEKITPNNWYWFGQYKIYFTTSPDRRRWYAKVYPKKATIIAEPLMMFDGWSKTELLAKIDAFCFKTFGKKCRYREIPGQVERPSHYIPRNTPREEPKAPKKEPKRVYNVDEAMQQHVEDFTKRWFEFLWDLTEYLIQIKKLCRVWFICTQIMILMLLFVIIFLKW